MKEKIKRLLIVLTSLLAVITSSLFVVSVVIDPNDYKAQAQSIAEQSGIELHINGDIEWQLFPLGLRLHQVNLADRQRGIISDLPSLVVGINGWALLGLGDADIRLPVRSIEVKDGRLRYVAPGNLPIQISRINLDINDFSLNGSEFPIKASLQGFNGLIFFFEANISAAVENHKLDRLVLSDLMLRMDQLRLTGNIDVSRDMSSIKGDLNIDSLDLRRQLKTLTQVVPRLQLAQPKNPTALTDVSINSDFILKPKDISEVDTRLTVDGQALDIRLQMDQRRRKLMLAIEGDRFNLTDYLISASDRNGTQSFMPLALPFALWHGQSEIELDLGALQMGDITVKNIYGNLSGNQTRLDLTAFNADMFNGQVNIAAKLDRHNPIAQFSLQSSLDDIDLSTLLTGVSGNLSVDANMEGSGNDVVSAIKSLKGSGQFDVTPFYFERVNVEQSLCDLLTLFGGNRPSPRHWPEGTHLDELNGRFQLIDGQRMVNNLQMNIGNINVSSRVDVDIVRQAYQLEANVLVNDSVTSENGCPVSQPLQNVAAKFICDGKLGKSANCKPAPDMINALFENSLKYLQKAG